MATSIEYDMVVAVENEISCPVCWEDFEEPKCLPNCAHNVCQHCLEGMEKKRNEAIECPICRVESIIPYGGVAAFPKNHLLVRLIDQTPGRKEQKRIKEAVKKCEEKVEGAKTAIKEMEDRFETAKIQDEKTMQEIKSLAEAVVIKVRKQEQKMLSQIKNRQTHKQKSIQTLKSDTLKKCENASGSIQTVNCNLQNFESKNLKYVSRARVSVDELNEFTESLEMCMLKANFEFSPQSGVMLARTDKVRQFIEDECFLGELFDLAKLKVLNDDIAEPASVPSVSEAAPGPSSRDFSRCGSLIQTIDSSSCGIAPFTPFSVAASRNSGHIVVLDEDTKWVHIFDEEGDPLNKFCITFGDLWDVAVSNENEIVVVNRESNRLLHYNMNGNFKKSLTAAKENVKVSSLSIDIHGRFIISSHSFNDFEDDVTSCILVYNPSGNLILSFGEEILSEPVKAVFLNGKFFVTDSNLESASVVVFDKNGIFLETFGVCELEDPVGIAADHINGNLVVCERKKSSIYIYSQTGRLRHQFQTTHKPIEVAFTKNYKKLLICCESQDDDKSYFIQIVTYL